MAPSTCCPRFDVCHQNLPPDVAPSAVEDVPADVVAAALVLQHEVAHGVGQTLALPPALGLSCYLRLPARCRRHRRLDGVRRGAHRVTAGSAGLPHRLRSRHPRPRGLDRPPRTYVVGPRRLEEPEDVLRTL